MQPILRLVSMCAALLTLFAAQASADERTPLIVFAAASLREPLERLEPAAPVRYVVSPGASGALARQIEQHAPAAIFAAADPRWMDYLAQRQLLGDGGRVQLARNSLVVIAPAATRGDRLRTLQDLPGRLLPEERWATADPATAPLGVYAFEALSALGIADAMRPRVALTQDAAAAVQLVAHGGARYGIVYTTDARLSRDVRIQAQVPDTLHHPIVYEVSALAGAPPEANRLIQFWTSPTGQRVFHNLGFAPAERHQ